MLACPSWCLIQTNSSSSTKKNAASLKDSYTHSDQPISGLKLFLRLLVVVNQRESGAPPTTEMRLETECNDTSLVGLVEGGELLRELAPGNIGSGGVEDVNDELTSGQETVGDEFARADGHWGVGLTGGRRECVSICRPI